MVNLFGKSEKIISPTKNIKQWTDDLIQCLCSGPTNNQGYSYLPLYIDTVDNQVDLYIDGIGKEIKFGGGVRCVDGNLVSAVKISVSIISDLSHLNQDDVPKHSIGYFSIFDRNGLQNFPECGVILIGGRELETQIEDLIIKSRQFKKNILQMDIWADISKLKMMKVKEETGEYGFGSKNCFIEKCSFEQILSLTEK